LLPLPLPNIRLKPFSVIHFIQIQKITGSNAKNLAEEDEEITADDDDDDEDDKDKVRRWKTSNIGPTRFVTPVTTQ